MGSSPDYCLETKEVLQRDYLADLLLIANSVSIGGSVRPAEEVMEAWRRMSFLRSDRVWLKVTLDNQTHTKGSDPGACDVLLNASNDRLEIWHDLPMHEFTHHSHLFAEPLAMGLFNNRLLTDAFAAYLGAGARKKQWLADRYDINDDERKMMNTFINQKMLTGEALEQLLTLLFNLPEWNGYLVNQEELKIRWWDLHFYIEHRLALSATDLQKRVPPNLAECLPRLDPTTIQTRHWEQSFNKDLLQKAVWTILLDQGGQQVEQAVDEMLLALCVIPKDVCRFDFDPLVVQKERLQHHIGVELNYSEWCEEKKHVLHWLSAERILAGEMDSLLIPVHPASVATRTIVSVSHVGRSVMKQSQEDREKTSRNNSRTGMSAEHRVVLEAARNLLSSQNKASRWQEILAIWNEVQTHFDTPMPLPANCPEDPHSLVRALHVASTFGDGLGFDVLDVGVNPNEVWLTEVKSATGLRLFLSENERLKALLYEKKEPLKGRWRMKVWLPERQWAEDSLTQTILEVFNDIEKCLRENQKVRPEGWIFQLGSE
ncbi:MAG: hypothetical protein HQL93_11850 [Magnetococcales bacterium]|nr:hypothetical protein [Magnetococcales bacterium]